MTKKRFVLIGAAGYVATRHFRAIKENDGELVAALDISDSVGVLDSYFPECFFFTEMGRFDRFLVKYLQSGGIIDFLVVCSPNHMHDTHVRFGLRLGLNVICEKPVVLNPRNLKSLIESKNAQQQAVYNILQLRLHPSIIALKQRVDSTKKDEVFEVGLTYLTSRGHWYYASWKADIEKSGGIATNIGIHFFDMLIWIFGEVVESDVHVHSHDRAGGFLKLKRANVKWFLSIDHNLLPSEVRQDGKSTYRLLEVGDDKYHFSEGFEDLHNKSYQQILSGKGFDIEDALPSITIAQEIREDQPILDKSKCHELCLQPQRPHPFNY